MKPGLPKLKFAPSSLSLGDTAEQYKSGNWLRCLRWSLGGWLNSASGLGIMALRGSRSRKGLSAHASSKQQQQHFNHAHLIPLLACLYAHTSPWITLARSQLSERASGTLLELLPFCLSHNCAGTDTLTAALALLSHLSRPGRSSMSRSSSVRLRIRCEDTRKGPAAHQELAGSLASTPENVADVGFNRPSFLRTTSSSRSASMR